MKAIVVVTQVCLDECGYSRMVKCAAAKDKNRRKFDHGLGTL